MKSLFQLVKSLDKSEKRYFKLFCQKHVINGRNNDAELFDAIVSLKEFTEESLRAALKNDKIISNLSVYKHILYRNIKIFKCISFFSNHWGWDTRFV